VGVLYFMHLDVGKAEFGRILGAHKKATQGASALKVANTSYALTCMETNLTFRLDVFARIPINIRCINVLTSRDVYGTRDSAFEAVQTQ